MVRDAYVRVEVHDEQVLGLSVAPDALLRLQEVRDVVVVQQEAVDRALVKERLPIVAGENFYRHRALVQGAAVHRAVPAAPDQLMEYRHEGLNRGQTCQTYSDDNADQIISFRNV